MYAQPTKGDRGAFWARRRDERRGERRRSPVWKFDKNFETFEYQITHGARITILVFSLPCSARWLQNRFS